MSIPASLPRSPLKVASGETIPLFEMGGGKGVAPCPITPLLSLVLPSSAPHFFIYRKRVPATSLHFYGEDGRSTWRPRELEGLRESQLCQAPSSDDFIKPCWQGIFVCYLTFFILLFLTPFLLGPQNVHILIELILNYIQLDQPPACLICGTTVWPLFHQPV